MQVIVLDNKNDEIDRFEGTYANGVFKYKEGGNKIPLTDIVLQAIEKTLPLSYKKLVRINNVKTAFVVWDGKDYKQITPTELTGGKYMISPDQVKEPQEITDADKKMTQRDYTRESKLSDMMIDEQLSKPFDVNKLAEWIGIIIVAILSLTAYFGSGNIAKASQNMYKPLNVTLQQNYVLIKMLQNQTHQLYNLYSTTLNRTYGGNP